MIRSENRDARDLVGEANRLAKPAVHAVEVDLLLQASGLFLIDFFLGAFPKNYVMVMMMNRFDIRPIYQTKWAKAISLSPHYISLEFALRYIIIH